MKRGFDINQVVHNINNCDYRRANVSKAPKNFNIEVYIEMPPQSGENNNK
jgi:hypothetical protein